MPKVVKWTQKADESFEEIIEYLNKEWSGSEVSNFARQTLETIDVISLFPQSFVQDENSGFRKARINNVISLIYLEKQEHIELLYFWNNRKNSSSSIISDKEK